MILVTWIQQMKACQLIQLGCPKWCLAIYESDYEVQSSPLPPPYSLLSPVVKYVLFAVCALFLNEHLHYHLYDHREPPFNLKEAVQLIVEDLAPKCSDDILQLRIRRGDLVQDAIHEGKKGKFIPGKQLQVSN